MDNNINRPNGMSDTFYNHCMSITSKRPKTIILHLLKYGSITTEEISDLYGYDHPPRAIRDVRENGIPLITYKVKSNKTGRIIGAYKFGDESEIIAGRIGGRKAFSKQFKSKLIGHYGEKSTLTNEHIDSRYLQIDHRIPYQVSGNSFSECVGNYMLLDASDQRAKSWSCENCINFDSLHNIFICKTCFWAYPENYTHIALKQQRRLYILWDNMEIDSYNKLKKIATNQNIDIQTLIKEILNNYLENN